MKPLWLAPSLILEQACYSDTLSIECLQRIIDENIIDTDDLKESTFFHYACYNKNITKDIINFLLDFYPQAAEIATDYFCLHMSLRIKKRKHIHFIWHFE